MSSPRRQPGDTDDDDHIDEQNHEAYPRNLHGLMHSQSPGAVLPRNRRSSFLSLGRGGEGPVRAGEIGGISDPDPGHGFEPPHNAP